MGNARNLGSLLNTSSTIQADDLNIGQLGNRNKIINGGFDVWQRGTSFSSSSVNEYSADRFRTEGFGLSTTISRQSFTAGQTDVPGFPTYFCRVATSATVGSGQYWAFQQRAEVPQVVTQGQTYTLSFWIRATSTTIAANVLSYGFSSGLVGFPELTTTWQKVTRTLTFGASQISGSQASIYIVYAPQNTAAFSVDIAQVQLEPGDVATPFEHRSYGQELALCQRYYQTLISGPLRMQINNVERDPRTISPEMRATPTLTKSFPSGSTNIVTDVTAATSARNWYIDLQISGFGVGFIDTPNYTVIASAEL